MSVVIFFVPILVYAQSSCGVYVGTNLNHVNYYMAEGYGNPVRGKGVSKPGVQIGLYRKFILNENLSFTLETNYQFTDEKVKLEFRSPYTYKLVYESQSHYINLPVYLSYSLPRLRSFCFSPYVGIYPWLIVDKKEKLIDGNGYNHLLHERFYENKNGFRRIGFGINFGAEISSDLIGDSWALDVRFNYQLRGVEAGAKVKRSSGAYRIFAVSAKYNFKELTKGERKGKTLLGMEIKPMLLMSNSAYGVITESGFSIGLSSRSKIANDRLLLKAGLHFSSYSYAFQSSVTLHTGYYKNPMFMAFTTTKSKVRRNSFGIPIVASFKPFRKSGLLFSSGILCEFLTEQEVETSYPENVRYGSFTGFNWLIGTSYLFDIENSGVELGIDYQRGLKSIFEGQNQFVNIVGLSLAYWYKI